MKANQVEEIAKILRNIGHPKYAKNLLQFWVDMQSMWVLIEPKNETERWNKRRTRIYIVKLCDKYKLENTLLDAHERRHSKTNSEYLDKR